jgi:ribonuclease P protein component
VLAQANRLRSSKDFARTTKVGHRASSHSLVLYLHTSQSLPATPQIGLIINKSVGGSVLRHRIARQLRHAIRKHLTDLPNHSQLVIRTLRPAESYTTELAELVEKITKRSSAKA